MPRVDQEPITVFTISPSAEFKGFVFEKLEGVGGMVADGSTANLKTALEEVRDVEPNVVILDKAMPGNLVSLAKRIRTRTLSARILLAGQTISATETHFLYQAGVNGFLTKPELETDLLPTIGAAADQKTRFSPQVRNNLRAQGEIGPFLNSPLPQIPDYLVQALEEVGYSTESSAYRGYPEMNEFRTISETEGLYAPFRFAIQMGILPAVDVSDLIPRVGELPESRKKCLREYLRWVPSTQGGEAIFYDRSLFTTLVTTARANLGQPSYVDLILVAANSELLPFDEIGSRVVQRQRGSVRR